MYIPFQPLLYTAIGAASLFYLIVRYSLSHWKKRGILHQKPKFLWGHLKGVGSKKHLSTVLHRIYAENSGKAPFVGFFAYLRPMLVVLDHDLVRRILIDDAEYFVERGLYNNASGDPLTDNMLQLDGASWKQLNGKLNPIFNAKPNKLLPAFSQVTATFERSLASSFSGAQKTCNILELVNDFNVDVCATLAYGLEPRDAPHTEFMEMTTRYFNNFHTLKSYLAWCFPALARFLQYGSYDPLAAAYFLRLVCERLKDHSWQNRVPQHDFLAQFAELQQRSSLSDMPLKKKQIAAQLFTFVLIGREAANATLAFCLYELAVQSDIQEKARDEIIEILKQHHGQISLESLSEMMYLKQILYETLRKHNPYPLLVRQTVKDYEIPNSVFMLQKGNRLIIPIAAIHHDPLLYPQPELFDPERFKPEAVAARPSFSFLPFGAGPRACIARQFAELQLLVCLITLLRGYRFSLSAETKLLSYDNTRLLLHTPQPDLKLQLTRL